MYMCQCIKASLFKSMACQQFVFLSISMIYETKHNYFHTTNTISTYRLQISVILLRMISLMISLSILNVDVIRYSFIHSFNQSFIRSVNIGYLWSLIQLILLHYHFES